jgi:hypothetical protein
MREDVVVVEDDGGGGGGDGDDAEKNNLSKKFEPLNILENPYFLSYII